MGYLGLICYNLVGNLFLVFVSFSSMTYLGKGKDLVLVNFGYWSVEMRWWVIRKGRED